LGGNCGRGKGEGDSKTGRGEGETKQKVRPHRLRNSKGPEHKGRNDGGKKKTKCRTGGKLGSSRHGSGVKSGGTGKSRIKREKKDI